MEILRLIGDVVLIEGQSGGSIVGITPGLLNESEKTISITKTNCFSSGAALEKKSVRDMAAGLNRLGGKEINFIFSLFSMLSLEFGMSFFYDFFFCFLLLLIF